MSTRRKDSRPKSLPPTDLETIVSSDSGLDVSPVSSTHLDTEDMEEVDRELEESPLSFILGEAFPQRERIAGVSKAIEWLQTELKNMKLKDRELARIMITMRSRIQETKLQLEQAKDCKDKGYGSDNDTTNSDKLDEEEFNKEQWKLIKENGNFPTDSASFDNNKRATWAI